MLRVQAEVHIAVHVAQPIIDLEVEQQDIEIQVVRQHIETPVGHQDTGVQEVVLPDTEAQGAVAPAQGVQVTAALEVAQEVPDTAEVPEEVHEDPVCEVLAVLPDLLVEAEGLQEVAEAVAEGISHPNTLIS